ncbi:MAG: tetratricopeptide repeat protein [Limisphaerales bacterium]
MKSTAYFRSNEENGKSNLAAELCLALLLVGAFCLATNLSQWFRNWPGNRAASANLMAVAMGDARRLFANQFFVKADAYFHSGMYPTIYDNRQSFQTPHIAEDSGAMKGKNTGDETAFLGPPRNWIDAFGRQFFPSVHTHLSEGGANGQEGEGTVGEILPWLKLSTELDPKRVETYTVTAYWLRRMDKIDESEQELREGLKENPGNPQLLFDLGRLFLESLHNPVGARNVWEAGLRNLAALPDKDSDQNKFVAEQILGALAHQEEKEHHPNQAIAWLEQMKKVSTTPQAAQQWINELKGQKRP